MSGFLVILDLEGGPVDPALLQRLTARLADRGPDGRRLWSEGCIGMGHALFRTTDQDAYASQPASLDGATRLVSNARIDDRHALLDRLGDGQETDLERTPDTELILRAFRKWGRACPARLLGDFAFALWDGRSRRLFCARDRLGMRPLYYARVGSELLISNSLYCLLGHPGVSRRLDEEAVGGFLLFGDHAWLDKRITAFAAIRSVPPAHCLLIERGRVEVRRYWDFPIEVPLLRYRRERDYLEHFRHLFDQAIGDRLRTDSVVVAMSGGMDSSAMAATVHRLGRGLDAPVRQQALTLLYDGILPSDERRYAAQVADHLGIAIHYLDAGRYPFLQPPIATARPLEYYNPAAWAGMFERAAGYGRVLLHGEGGDSLFAYSSGPSTLAGVSPVKVLLDLARMRRRYGVRPGLGTGALAGLRRMAGRDGADSGAAPYPYPGWLDPAFEYRLGLRERWDGFWRRRPSPLNARHPNMHQALVGPEWELDGLFLHPGFTPPEVRDPFLDLRLIEFVLALPPLPWTFRKHLLRRCLEDDLPATVIRRPKTPLGEVHLALLAQPDARWVRDWTAPVGLGAYLDLGKIPGLDVTRSDPGYLYVNLRPLLLERWIEALDHVFQ